jgi:hypothetical protein
MSNNFKELDLYSQDYAFRTLVQEVWNKIINLNPRFQREYKWDKDWNKRWSKFIESCLMRIPLPACYFREFDNWNFDVIDWVQRITTIKNFIENKFPLEGLSVIENLNWKFFNELDPVNQTDIKNYTMRCIILRRTNPLSIVNEIFARLNQWSVKLSEQEIRKALYDWNFYKLLEELSNNKFIKTLAWKKKSDDLLNHELVLRFFCMSTDLKDYNWLLHEYLDDFMIKNRDLDKDQINKFKILFNQTIDTINKIFWDFPFSNSNKERKKSSIVIYDLLMRYCRQYDLTKIDGVKEKLSNFFWDEAYKKSVSWWVRQKQNIIKRRKLLIKYFS